MQFKKTILSWIIFIVPALGFSQSTSLPLQSKHQQLLERLSIMHPGDTGFNFSTAKPRTRKEYALGIAKLDSLAEAGDPLAGRLSKVDRYMMKNYLMNNSEWFEGDKSSFQ
ncbi:MAG: hypothetical protein H7Y27_06765, partial [Gemmatimonadaceae bacterium]|nr:hypothetical protein [Chitinophagaceae bacterium]